LMGRLAAKTGWFHTKPGGRSKQQGWLHQHLLYAKYDTMNINSTTPPITYMFIYVNLRRYCALLRHAFPSPQTPLYSCTQSHFPVMSSDSMEAPFDTSSRTISAFL
jgi:hypothetical protein